MGWSGSLTANSAVGASITYAPDTPESVDLTTKFISTHNYAGNYSVSSFKAPKKGVYKFVLKGSGGAKASGGSMNIGGYSLGATGGAAGGTGGTTTGYLLLEANQTVYVGAGGVCRAAFVSSVNGASLAAIAADKLYFVAGAGGSGGSWGDGLNNTGYNCKTYTGGNGGGSTGADGAVGDASTVFGGKGGTQTAGGSCGEVNGSYSTDTTGTYGTGTYGTGATSRAYLGDKRLYAVGGRGGDGYYGGGSGWTNNPNTGAYGTGGGGGSGYVKTASIKVGSNTYTSTTAQGGGAAANGSGSVVVTYYARADIPVIFNGTRLERIFFNGIDVQSLIYNGTKLFCERIKRRMNGWFMSIKTGTVSTALI